MKEYYLSAGTETGFLSLKNDTTALRCPVPSQPDLLRVLSPRSPSSKGQEVPSQQTPFLLP